MWLNFRELDIYAAPTTHNLPHFPNMLGKCDLITWWQWKKLSPKYRWNRGLNNCHLNGTRKINKSEILTRKHNYSDTLRWITMIQSMGGNDVGKRGGEGGTGSDLISWFNLNSQGGHLQRNCTLTSNSTKNKLKITKSWGIFHKFFNIHVHTTKWRI